MTRPIKPVEEKTMEEEQLPPVSLPVSTPHSAPISGVQDGTRSKKTTQKKIAENPLPTVMNDASTQISPPQKKIKTVANTKKDRHAAAAQIQEWYCRHRWLKKRAQIAEEELREELEAFIASLLAPQKFSIGSGTPAVPSDGWYSATHHPVDTPGHNSARKTPHSVYDQSDQRWRTVYSPGPTPARQTNQPSFLPVRGVTQNSNPQGKSSPVDYTPRPSVAALRAQVESRCAQTAPARSRSGSATEQPRGEVPPLPFPEQ